MEPYGFALFFSVIIRIMERLEQIKKLEKRKSQYMFLFIFSLLFMPSVAKASSGSEQTVLLSALGLLALFAFLKSRKIESQIRTI